MTEEEICRFYKSAKDKKTQITILSQLSGYPKEKVIAILIKKPGRVGKMVKKAPGQHRRKNKGTGKRI